MLATTPSANPLEPRVLDRCSDSYDRMPTVGTRTCTSPKRSVAAVARWRWLRASPIAALALG